MLIAVLAWLWLWRKSVAMGPDTSMPGMEMPAAAIVSPSDATAYLTSAFVMWFLMMVAMMLPSAAPMILLYSRFARVARAQGASSRRRRFLSAYLAVWGGFSALAALAQWLLVRLGAVRNGACFRQSAHWRRSPDRRRTVSSDAAQAKFVSITAGPRCHF